jgi:hypothetical protein
MTAGSTPPKHPGGVGRAIFARKGVIEMSDTKTAEPSTAGITAFIVKTGLNRPDLDKRIAKKFPGTYSAQVHLAKDAARLIMSKKRVKCFQDLEDKWSEGGTEIHDGIKMLLHCLLHNDQDGTTEAVTKDIVSLFAREIVHEYKIE